MTRLSWRTAGESHGKTLVGVVEGVPAGLTLDVERIDAELVRRQGGYGRGGRMKIERDHVEVLSGLKGGVTLGSPIAFEVPNRDQTIEELPTPSSPRPGHADLAGCQKYGHRDARAILERASARPSPARWRAPGWRGRLGVRTSDSPRGPRAQGAGSTASGAPRSSGHGSALRRLWATRGSHPPSTR